MVGPAKAGAFCFETMPKLDVDQSETNTPFFTGISKVFKQNAFMKSANHLANPNLRVPLGARCFADLIVDMDIILNTCENQAKISEYSEKRRLCLPF